MVAQIISKDFLVEQALARRMEKVKAGKPSKHQDAWIAELSNGKIPVAVMPESFHLKELNAFNNRTFAEIDTASVATQFLSRQQYEVDAGRDMEPLLFPAIYNIVRGPFGAQTIDILRTGPLGVVFELTPEGGEVKFVTLQSSTDAVKIQKYTQGIHYTEELIRFNKGWQLPILERQFGQAANALQNYVHLQPILAYAYGAANQTAASAIGSTLVEKTHNTIDDAITNSRTDQANPRRGPYVILCASNNLSTIRRAVTRADQQGFALQSPEVFDSIRAVIAYDGWSGTRGNAVTTYSGVTANKCYLIDISHANEDFQSFYEQELRRQMGDPDKSRFIVEETLWDMWFAAFANPLRAVEEVTLPTS